MEGGEEVWAFWVPEVFLLVAVEDGAGGGDEVGGVGEVVVAFFDDGAGDDVDVESMGCVSGRCGVDWEKGGWMVCDTL